MTTEVEKLQELSKNYGIKVAHHFPGTNENATPEQIAAEINKAILAVAAGNYEVVSGDDLD